MILIILIKMHNIAYFNNKHLKCMFYGICPLILLSYDNIDKKKKIKK